MVLAQAGRKFLVDSIDFPEKRVVALEFSGPESALAAAVECFVAWR